MQHDTVITPRLIKPRQAAEYLALSERKLWGLTKAGDIPAVRLGRAVRYDLSDLDTFIQGAKGEGVTNAPK